MVRPLKDPAFFARVFVELGALTWPNGYDLDPIALHDRMAAAGELTREVAEEALSPLAKRGGRAMVTAIVAHLSHHRPAEKSPAFRFHKMAPSIGARREQNTNCQLPTTCPGGLARVSTGAQA